MPRLSEDVPNWDELTDDERERLRAALAEIGLRFPEDDDDQDDDGYYE